MHQSDRPHPALAMDDRCPASYTQMVKGQRAERAREWGARGKALPEKAKRPPGRPANRTPTCSPCSSEKGSLSPPLRRQHLPSISRKGCCGQKPPQRCWQHRAGRNCWNTSGSARRCRAGSSPPYTAHRWSATPSWSSSSRLRKPPPCLPGRHAGPRPGDRRL